MDVNTFPDVILQASKYDAAMKRVLTLGKGMTRNDYRHPNYQKLQTAMRAFKREDGRLQRLKAYWAGQLALQAEGVLDADFKWKDEA
jgi:hypothetical protein